MPAAHASYHWPAAAPFSEHGQHARHCQLLGSHGYCAANDNVMAGLNKLMSFKDKIRSFFICSAKVGQNDKLKLKFN